MRVAIVSDVHGNLRGLDACLADLASQGGADVIVAAGDLCMDGPKPRSVLKRLRDIGAKCLRGNTDRYIAIEPIESFGGEEREGILWQREQLGPEWLGWLAALPTTLQFGRHDNALIVTHANPKNDDEHVWPDAPEDQLERLFGDVHAAAIAFGHLHVPYVRTWRGKLLVNVSSAGLPKDGDERAHYAILTDRPGGWEAKSRRVDFDVERTVRDYKKSEMPHLDKRIGVLRRHRYKTLGAMIP